VPDARDGRIGHLVGLNFSRAAACRALASALPAADVRVGVLRRAAERHLGAALPVLDGGGYLGDHWWATFAARAMDP
jgi:hypothetical protein